VGEQKVIVMPNQDGELMAEASDAAMRPATRIGAARLSVLAAVADGASVFVDGVGQTDGRCCCSSHADPWGGGHSNASWLRGETAALAAILTLQGGRTQLHSG